METPIEAYNFTLEMVEKLKEHGITVKVKESRSRNSESAIKKYDKPDRVPPEMWNHVTLCYETADQRTKIYEATRYLGMVGIYFDTGGCANQYDWEMDWSFSYQKGREDWEKMEAQEWLDDMKEKIDKCQNKSCDE